MFFIVLDMRWLSVVLLLGIWGGGLGASASLVAGELDNDSLHDTLREQIETLRYAPEGTLQRGMTTLHPRGTPDGAGRVPAP